MGNPKQKWTKEEEEALRAGVAKHGSGKWKFIQQDPDFTPFLSSRSNIDLKDKWRNMCVNEGNGPREKSRTPKAKPNPDTLATPLLIAQTPASSTPATPLLIAYTAESSTPAIPLPAAQTAESSSLAIPLLTEQTYAAMDKSSKPTLDGKTPLKWDTMIYEALSTIKDPNGSDTSAIVGFIEQRNEVPQNFRKVLGAKLRRLVARDKLEKVHNCYRIKTDALPGARAPNPKHIEIQPRHSQTISVPATTEQEASAATASKIAEAEHKQYVAAEAAKEQERVSKMAEDANSLLVLAQDMFAQCIRGEIMLMS